MSPCRAFVLNREHHLFVETSHGESGPSMRTHADLAAAKEYLASVGLAPHAPAGVDPPTYFFIYHQPPTPAAGLAWRPVGRLPQPLKSEFVSAYARVLLGGYEPPAAEWDVFAFGNTLEMASRLAHLVIKGRKRATSAGVDALRETGATVPSAGLVSIVTDGFGIPLCCIRTERTEIRKFSDMPESVARGEGEGDLSLADWREGHWRYFTEEARALGIPFDEKSEVLTEWFEVLKVFGKED